MSGGVLVLNPSVDALQVPLVLSADEINSQSTTPASKSFAIPQSFVEVAYQQGVGAAATGKMLYVVLNATSDNGATTKLGLAGLRFPIPLGEARKFVFPASALCSRIDFVTDQAESGTSKIILTTGV